MSATLGDPYLLATYALPSKSAKAKGKSVAADEHPYVFASHSAVPKRDDGQVTLAIQGDGIHVYDLADLHPISSHTLGPSTSFASAPATVVAVEDEKSFRRTYVTIQCSQEAKAEDAGKIIWSWKEEISRDIGSSQDKRSTTLPHEAAYVLAPQNLDSVLVVARNGRLTQTDPDLNVLNSWAPQDALQTVVKLFAFARRDCQFISGGVPPNGVVLLMFVTRGEDLFVQIIAFGHEREMVVLEPLIIPIESVDDIVDVSCDASGHASILESNGLWSPYRIDTRNGKMSVTATPSCLHLKGLDFISKKKLKTRSQVSLLSLGSAYVLLAGITAAPEIALLLWDIQYGVLLHSHMLPVPSTLEKNPSAIAVSLVQGSSTQALVVLSPANIKAGSSQLRSSVLVVPFAVPRISTIAGAMGRAAQGAPWLEPEHRAAPSQDAGASPYDSGKETLLEKLQDAVEEERIADADKLFFEWAKRKDDRWKGKAVASAPAGDGDADGPQDADMEEGDPSKPQGETKTKPIRSAFDHAFVKRVLQIVLQPEDPAGKPYSPKICRYLLTRHLASNNMIDGGLLSVLLQHNDWESIRECLFKVIDIPESDLIRTLHIVVQQNRARSSLEEDDAMAVDQPKIPATNSFLAYILEYPASPLAWRKALREHFADAEDLVCLLNVLDEWVAIHTAKDLPLGLSEVTVNEHGIPVVASAVNRKLMRTKGILLPTMENILGFLQAILDSSFLRLLQSPSSHALIQRLSENITPHVTLSADLESLRGPLAPFAKAQMKALAEAGSGRTKESVDWRKRRRQAQEQSAINLGPYQAHIFFVLEGFSDTASKDASGDKSGPLIAQLVAEKDFAVAETRIVPDDEELIRESVKAWSATGDIDWIITTGGTGFGIRDRTPEAIRPILERDAPGIVHLLLSASLAHTPLAALSRPVAGTVRGSHTLVVTLPGSAKAVRENLTALLNAGVVSHALDLLRGGTGKEVHSALAEGRDPGLAGNRHGHEHGHHEHHHHDHHHNSHKHASHDGNFPAASRHRISPYALISYEMALETIYRLVPNTEVERTPVTPALKGSLLAEDVYAPHDVPASTTTNMDGYAVRSSNAPGLYRVLTPQVHALATPLPEGSIYRINTGAPLPAGTDSVVIVEETQLVTSTPDEEESEVRTLVQTSPGENVRAPGSDVEKGDLVLQKGELLTGTGGEIGTLAFVGRKEVAVYRRPVVAIMSTGNELVDLQGSSLKGSAIDQKSGEKWTGIWDTNRPSLQAALETMGYEVIDLGIVKDNIQAHVDTLKDGLSRADLVLTTGGTSMGASDLLKPVIEKHLEGTVHFGRVTIKPGKPTTFATIPVDVNGHKTTKAIFALPGNPASALVCFYIFVVPALRKMGGWAEAKCQLPRVRVQVMDSMRLDPRTEFHRVIISAGPDGLRAKTTGGQRSSRVASLSGANGLVVLPQKQEGGPTELKSGEMADAVLIGEIRME
ncbi:hypothetical protein DFH11DRAFT_1839063 [Phellopilus nigrolimitatus]|nr:hypothetical protein DFH11DRAFT_1839063 [Phellopilus nigrolimitatus]